MQAIQHLFTLYSFLTSPLLTHPWYSLHALGELTAGEPPPEDMVWPDWTCGGTLGHSGVDGVAWAFDDCKGETIQVSAIILCKPADHLIA